MDMKKVTLEKVRDCLRDEKQEVLLSEEVRKQAEAALEHMLELAE